MNTVIVYSYCGDKPSSSRLNTAYLSNHLAQKHGYKTVLYIDKKNKKDFIDIPYSEIIEFDDNILEKLPPAVWSAGKILAASIETRPFLHIDFDFLILNNNFYDLIKNEEFVTYHHESWWDEHTKIGKNFHENGVKYFIEKTKGFFGVNYKKDLKSYNFAIFGSCKQENIKIINEECRFIITALIKAKNIIQNQVFMDHISKNSFKNGGIPVIVEQILTMERIKNKLKSHYSLIKISHGKETFAEGLKYGLLHIWGAKNKNQISQQIQNTIKRLKKY